MLRRYPGRAKAVRSELPLEDLTPCFAKEPG